MLCLWGLTTIIRLTEIELFDLQKKIDGLDQEESDNAAEIIVQTDDLAVKLRAMYESAWDKESGYPDYQELVSDYKKHHPFIYKNFLGSDYTAMTYKVMQ